MKNRWVAAALVAGWGATAQAAIMTGIYDLNANRACPEFCVRGIA